jgi:putative transposase
MARFRRIENFNRIFFVTANLGRGVPPLSETERDIVLLALSSVREKHAFDLAGYVVMPDHLHLIISPGADGLATLMHAFKRSAHYKIALRRTMTDLLWQPRYFDNIIRCVRDFWEKLEYVHNNPVAAALSVEKRDWPWTSYGAYWGGAIPKIPVDKLELPTDGDFVLWPAPWKRPGS